MRRSVLMKLAAGLAGAALCLSRVALAQGDVAAKGGQVAVTGVVADEAVKAAVLARVRELYGADQVSDQLSIGSVSTPANWSGYMQKLIGPSLKLIRHGQLSVDGNTVTLRGDVANEAQRQQVASDVATSLNPSYLVNNALRVVAAPEQGVLDAALADRIIEFESGKAALTEGGKAILDQMCVALRQVGNKKVQVIGHTDNAGLRSSNLALSLARAEAVKAYVMSRGIAAGVISVAGEGPDRPVADNASVEGRARNRRIEFKVLP